MPIDGGRDSTVGSPRSDPIQIGSPSSTGSEKVGEFATKAGFDNELGNFFATRCAKGRE